MSSSALILKRLAGSSMSSNSVAKFFFSTRIRSAEPKCLSWSWILFSIRDSRWFSARSRESKAIANCEVLRCKIFSSGSFTTAGAESELSRKYFKTFPSCCLSRLTREDCSNCSCNVIEPGALEVYSASFKISSLDWAT